MSGLVTRRVGGQDIIHSERLLVDLTDALVDC
jgi:hypothetical protein